MEECKKETQGYVHLYKRNTGRLCQKLKSWIANVGWTGKEGVEEKEKWGSRNEEGGGLSESIFFG